MRSVNKYIFFALLCCLSIILTAGSSFAQLNPGKGIEIYDYFRNGVIDRAVIWFNTPLDSLSVEEASPTEFAVEGHLVRDVAVNQDNNRDGTPDGLKALTVLFHESGEYNTDFTPQVTYYGNSIRYYYGSFVSHITQYSAVEVDRAPPRLIRATAKDVDNDGLFDEYWLYMSEPVTSEHPGYGFFMTQAGYSFAENGHSIDVDIIRLAVNEKALPFGDKPTFTYESVLFGFSGSPPSPDNLSGIGDIRDDGKSPYGGSEPNYFYFNAQNSGDEPVPTGLLNNERIRIISPNGGERWRPGLTQVIAWETHNVALLKLDYSTDGGESWVPIASTVFASNEIYSWRVPDVSSDNCLVRISDVANPGENDVCYETFTISDPKISLSTESMDVGESVVGNSVTGTFLVSNIGFGDLIVSDISGYLDDFTVDVPSFIVPADSSQVVTVIFNPPKTGIIRDILTITSNDFDHGTRTVRVSGRGISPEIAVSPAIIDFGNVQLGSDSTMTFIIKNEGVGDLEITEISSDSEIFTVDQAPFTLSQNTSREVTVTFTPPKLEYKSGTIMVKSNDFDEPAVYVSTSGTGVTPEITLSTRYVRFGNIEIGSSASKNFTITNEGTGDLVVSSISIDNEVFTVDQTAFIVPPDSSHVVKLTFNPVDTGYKSDLITITNNDLNEGILQLNINGTGVILDFNVSPSAIDIGNVDVGSNSSESFTITNNGTVNLNITGISSNLDEFTFDTSTALLSPGKSRTIAVIFSPAAIGVRNATIDVNTSMGSISVEATGTGIGAKGSVSPLSIDIGEVEVGSSSQGIIAIANEGNDDLIITGISSNRTTFTVDHTSFTIPPNSSSDVTVTFIPNKVGLRTATIEISSNDIEQETFIVSANAEGIPPRITVSTSTVSIGDIELGGSGSGNFTLTNEGNIDQIVSTISSDNGAFTVAPDSVSLQPGQSEIITVTFIPVTSGSRNSTITIESNNIEEATLTVNVHGRGVTPDISVSPSSIDFEDVVLGTGESKSFTIKNDGTSDLVVSTIESNNNIFTVAPDSVSIEPGQSETVSVTFSPVTTGTQSAVIMITSNDLDEKTVTVNTQGTGVTPDITISLESIDFGNILAASSDSKSFTITNDGTSDLIVSPIISDDDAFTVTPDSVSVEPGQNETITVTFSPVMPGDQSATITLTTNDLDEETVTVSLTGMGITPEITVSPISIDFGNVEVGSSVSESFAISNDGTSDLIVSSMLSDNDAITVSPASVSVKPENSTTVTVTFSPVTPGTQNAAITITSNDLDEVTASVSITGIGVTPDIALSPVSLNIGNVSIGSSGSGNFVITNDGTSDLIVSEISSSNDAFAVNPASASISPGNSKSITVIFTPSTKGAQNSLIRITSNDLDEETLTVEASGTGTTPEITVLPASINAGEVFVGSTVSRSFTIINEGTSTLVAGTIGSDNNAFTVTPESASIEPGESATVTVTFAPTTKGSQSAVITVASNDLDEGTATVNVSGTGTIPVITVSPPTIDMGDVEIGSSSTKSFTIMNEDKINQVSIEISSDNDRFTVTPSSLTIEPGERETIELTFMPAEKGSQSAAITIISNGIIDDAVKVNVSGTGVIPRITVSPATIDIGDVELGSSSTGSFAISNDGNVDNVVCTISTDSNTFIASPSSVALEPGESKTLTLTFSPTRTGSQEAAITITSNDIEDGAITVRAVGTGIAPRISVLPDPIDFGDVELGISKSIDIAITNEGNLDQVENIITVDSNSFAVSPSSATLGPEESRTITVTFSPTRAGSHEATITITGNGVDKGAVKVKAYGTGIAPMITVSAAMIDVGDVELGSSGSGSFTIANEGNIDHVISTITIDSNAFAAVPSSVTLEPGESKTVMLTFTPLRTGSQDAAITITNNATYGKKLTVTAHGKGIVPRVTVSHTTIHFGDVELGGSKVENFTIRNGGAVDRVVCNISSNSRAFTIIPSTVTLEPGESETIVLTFAPTRTESENAMITVTANGIEEEAAAVSADGSGVVPVITVSPTRIHFSNVELGSSVTESITVKNEGVVDRVVSDIISVNEAFIAIPGSVTLKPGQSETIAITFSPTKIGSHSSTVTITNNGIDEGAVTVSVNGNGVSPDITVTPLSIDFGDVIVGKGVSGRFVIKNDGTSELIVSDIISNKTDFVAASSSASLAPGSSKTVTVTFSPAAIGVRDAVIQVICNDPDEGIIKVSATGNGFRYSEISLSSSSVKQTSDVIVNYSIVEPHNQKVRLTVKYKVEGEESWNTATVKEDLSGIDDYNGSFTWSGETDIPGYEGKIHLAVTPNNGYIDGVQDTMVLDVNYNKPPSLTVNQMTGEYSGELAFKFDVFDAENDTVYVLLEYSLDGGETYLPAAVPEMTIPEPGEDKVIQWDTRKEFGYVYNQETILRLKVSDKYPGEQEAAGPFIVTNLVGDYNNNREIDSGDLLLFAEAWKTGDTTKEIGPVTGEEAPNLEILPDGKIDFEDLMVFAWMWRWWTEESDILDEPAKNVSEGSTSWDGLHLVPEKSGVCAVMCESRPDFLDLWIEIESGNTNDITIAGGEYWKSDGNSIVLTRSHENSPVELAAAYLEDDRELYMGGSYTLAWLNLAKSKNIGELTVNYTIRLQGNHEIYTGQITVSGDVLIQKPEEFIVFQNIPNPFNPSTTIEYILPEESHVTLTIYNMTGQKIAVLKNDGEPAGNHSVTWDAGELPSGIYFYTLKTRNHSVTKKMLLMK